MMLVQMPECGGFDLTWADRVRKSIAKKNPAEYEILTDEYFNAVKEKGLSRPLCNYVWNVLVATSRGYGFNLSHTLAYSLVALQEMNLAFRWPTIFWNCACLITDSGGAEKEEEEAEIVDIYEPEDFDEYEYVDAPDRKTKEKKKRAKTNNYDKIASAIGKMRSEGINIVPPDINKSSYTFLPDDDNNQIFFGLRGILNVGEDVIAATIANRPYASPKDYVEKVKPKKQSMISLIKGGAFDSMMDRKLCMGWYLWETCDRKQRLTLQNMPGLMKYNILPTDGEEFVRARRVYEFNRYLKAKCTYNSNQYMLDERALNFLIEIEEEGLIHEYLMNIKEWVKVYEKYMNIFRAWIADNKEKILHDLNKAIFLEAWEKYASGTISAWEMEALCFYYHEHELANLNQFKYGFSDFNELPEDPVVDKSFVKGGKTINIFKLTKICGTCIAKNKDKGLVTLLTPTGVVTVKFRKEYFALFDKQISERGADGAKHVIEKSWFNRGQMIVVQGMRSGDAFVAKKYASTGGHQLYKITEVFPNGEIALQVERYQGGFEEDGES
jgi:DNA polymerase-3 subunit alpha